MKRITLLCIILLNFFFTKAMAAEVFIVKKIEIEFSFYRMYSVNDMRVVLVDLVEDLLKRINSDPGLHEIRTRSLGSTPVSRPSLSP